MVAPSAETIVVVDDDPFQAFVFVEALRDIAVHVVAPATTYHAIERLSTDRHRLAVVDLGLPGVSGVDIGVLAARQGTSVMLVTGDHAAAKRLEAYGFPCVLRKPTPIAVMVLAARTLIIERVDACAAYLAAFARMEAETSELSC
jgi:CheY-like chemotaxis protein